MAEEHVRRRLAAILAADVVGYSRLMGADEEGTLNALKSRRELIDKSIDRFNGQIVGSAGDSVLVEFYSPVEAVRCALAIQVALRDMNAELPDHRRMEFRIGMNLGDVIEDGKTIYGDGVNVAARLEGLAEPGGITVAGSIYDQVKNKLDTIFDDLGQHAVKNIAEPVKVYRLRVDPEDAPPRLGRAWVSRLKSWHWVTIGVAAVLLFEGGGIRAVDPASVPLGTRGCGGIARVTRGTSLAGAGTASDKALPRLRVSAMRGVPGDGGGAGRQVRNGVAS